MRDPVWVVDPDRRYTFVNRYITERLETSRDEILGQPVAEKMDDYFSNVEHLDPLINGIDSILGGQKETEQVELTLYLDDEELARDIRLTPLEIDGERTGVVGVGRDITDHKKRERELELFRDLIDQSNDEIYVIDPESHQFVDVNETACRRLGYEHGELIDSSISEIAALPSVSGFEGIIETLANEVQEDRMKLEGTHEREDGTTYPVETTVSHVTTEEQPYLIAIARDITERKAREEALERHNDRLEAFARIISHDLRNPLNVATGNLELARDEYENDHLDTAKSALDRMDEMIDDLLTLAREGRTVEETEPVNLASIIEGCWRNVDTANAELVVEDDPTLCADASRLQHVLENLFRNAIEHGGPDVTVRIGELDDTGGFYVEDNGPDIPSEERDEVFDPRYSTSDEGTGLGLNIVREIIEAHGWDVTVTERTDGGARFEISGIERISG